jgi:hypothetical protein
VEVPGREVRKRRAMASGPGDEGSSRVRGGSGGRGSGGVGGAGCGRRGRRVREADQLRPSEQVVGQRGEDGPAARAVLIIRTPMQYCQPAFSRRSKTLVFQRPESARSSLTPLAPALVTRAISSSVKPGSPSACSPTPCAGGCAAPHGCPPWWRGSGDSPAAACTRRRRPASGARRPRRRSCRRR